MVPARRGAIAGLLIAVLAAAAPVLADCSLQAQDLTVTMRGTVPMVDVRIDDKPARLILDSGATFSLLWPSTVARLPLKPARTLADFSMVGGGGQVRASAMQVGTVTLGNTVLHGTTFAIAGPADVSVENVAGLLGQNILHDKDVEYDLGNGVLRFIQPSQDCTGKDLAYWTAAGSHSTVTLARTDGVGEHIIAKALLNGVELRVLLDSGSPVSSISQAAAERAGVRITDPGVRELGAMGGLGPKQVKTWIAPFLSFRIGAEEIRNTSIVIGGYDDSDLHADMILGADFFLSHRIYVANSQHRMFFTHNGGPVFALLTQSATEITETRTAGAASAVPGSQAEVLASADAFGRRGAARVARHDFSGGIADLTRACELEPGSARYRYLRSQAYLAQGDKDSAMADLDAALARDPHDLDALLARIRLRSGDELRNAERADLLAAGRLVPKADSLQGEFGQLATKWQLYQEAVSFLSDWISGNSNSPLLPQVLNNRCWARGLGGFELDEALADCNLSISLNGRDWNVFNSRGIVHLRRGEDALAAADFNTDLEHQPKSAWSMYGRGVVQLRQGQDQAGQADMAAALALDPTLGPQVAGLKLTGQASVQKGR